MDTFFCVVVPIIIGLVVFYLKVLLPAQKKREADAAAIGEPPPKPGCLSGCLLQITGWALIIPIGLLAACVLLPFALNGMKTPYQHGSVISDPPTIEAFERMHPTPMPTSTPLPQPTQTPILANLNDEFVEMGADVFNAGQVVKMQKGHTLFMYSRGSDSAVYLVAKKAEKFNVGSAQIGILCKEDDLCADKVRKYFEEKGVSIKEAQ